MITAIAAISAVAMSYRNSRKIEQVHISINSRMDQLLSATSDAARADGAKEERDKPRL
jgi:hypothetical protein